MLLLKNNECEVEAKSESTKDRIRSKPNKSNGYESNVHDNRAMSHELKIQFKDNVILGVAVNRQYFMKIQTKTWLCVVGLCYG